MYTLPCKVSYSPINKSAACKALTSESSWGVTSSFLSPGSKLMWLDSCKFSREEPLFPLPFYFAPSNSPPPWAVLVLAQFLFPTQAGRNHSTRNVSRAPAAAGTGEAEEVPKLSGQCVCLQLLTAACPKSHRQCQWGRLKAPLLGCWNTHHVSWGQDDIPVVEASAGETWDLNKLTATQDTFFLLQGQARGGWKWDKSHFATRFSHT